MSHLAVISETDQARLQRLADEAGRTPQEILEFVLNDGFEQTEREIHLINRRLGDSAQAGVPHDQAMERIERVLKADVGDGEVCRIIRCRHERREYL